MFDRVKAIRARLQAPLLLALAICIAWFALESMVYRSGAYFFVAEPDSNTGAVVTTLMVVERQYRPGARNILVFGDSRVGEGFSPQRAAGDDARFNFINLAVPGSTPRTWYYLLREIDRRGYRFDAVVVGTLYFDVDAAPRADWPLDPAHAASLVGLRDVGSFPATFAAPELRERARHAVLFPALALRQDTLALLEAPLARLQKVRRTRPGYLSAVREYPGRDETMPTLRFGDDGQRLIDWGTATPTQRTEVEAHLGQVVQWPKAVLPANDAFLGRWLGAMAKIAQRHGARLVVYPLPRGPYGSQLGDATRLTASLRSLQYKAGVLVLPPDLLADLEAPRFFFDTLHVNRAGRERTGTVVGARVRAALAEDAPR